MSTDFIGRHPAALRLESADPMDSGESAGNAGSGAEIAKPQRFVDQSTSLSE